MIGVGKIYDIFAGRGVQETYPNKGNKINMERTLELMDKDFEGLCFVNLVDFDMLYGHRNDIEGYTNALNQFDEQLELMMEKMQEDDLLIITADHGCDPGFKGTDHSREYVPCLCYGKKMKQGVNLGLRNSFADIAQTIAEYLNISYQGSGESFLDKMYMNKLELMKKANDIRKDIITAVHSAKAGHPGGSLSAADIYTYLYFEEMNIDPADPKMADRDRFVLSKGHTAPGYYSALAERGFFPVEDLKTLRHTGSYLQGHPDMKHIPGVDMSSGSLGQGISAAVGMAIAAKIYGDDYRVYTLLGDGEIQEGQVWEAAMLAGHRKIAKTVKGKGVSFMEDKAAWHGAAPNDEQYAVAMADLEKVGAALCQK